MACARGCCDTPAEHYRSLSIASAALPNRGRAVTAINRREDRWQQDMPAYRELRRQGVQPARIDGAHNLAQRAETRTEIERNVVLTDKQRRELRAVTDGTMT